MEEKADANAYFREDEVTQFSGKYYIAFFGHRHPNGRSCPKALLSSNTDAAPCAVVITNHRMSFVAAYAVQSKLSILEIPLIPISKKKEHELFADFSLRNVLRIRANRYGCEILLSTHGELPITYPKYKSFRVRIGIKRKYAKVLRDQLEQLIPGAKAIEEVGRFISSWQSQH